MADFDFNDGTGKRKPSQRDPVMLVLLCVVVIVGIVVAIMGTSKAAELSGLTSELDRMEQFMQSPETLRQIDEYNSIRSSIAALSRTRRPLQFAHNHFRKASTVTRSLVDGAIWEPMRDEEKDIEFERLTINRTSVSVDAIVDNLETAKLYQLALEEKNVIVNEHGIDKWPGAASEEGDQEISRFSDRFTLHYSLNRISEDLPYYSIVLQAQLNKDFHSRAIAVLGG